jgi:hypothetical protein
VYGLLLTSGLVLMVSLMVSLMLGAFIKACAGPTVRGVLRPGRCLDCGRLLTAPGVTEFFACAAAHHPAPTIYKAPACSWCGCRGWHAVDCRLAEAS